MRSRLPLILGGILILAVLALLFVLNRGGEERRVNRSTIGFSLLAPWLKSQGIAAEESNPLLNPQSDSLSIRILTLHDADLLNPIPAGLDKHAQFYSPTLLDSDYDHVLERLYQMPNLIVPPKWVAGSFARRAVHRSTLIPLDNYPELFSQLLSETDLRLIRPGSGFLREDTQWGTLALFEPQLFDPASLPDACRTVLPLKAGALVIRCEYDDVWPILLLSDPDLLNNHGLTLADNGAVTVGMLRDYLGDDTRPVYVDTHDAIFTQYANDDEADNQRRDYERDASALGRLFKPPLTALWVIMLAVLGLSFSACGIVLAGLPPLSGFVGKVTMMTALLNPNGMGAAGGSMRFSAWVLLALFILSGLLATIAYSRAGIRFFWSPRGRPAPHLKVIEVIPIGILLALCLLITVRAGPVLRYTEYTAYHLHAPHAYVDAIMGAPVKPGPTSDLHIPETPPAAPEAQP